MITEFINGCDGRRAVKEKKITLAKAFFYIGKSLKEVHKIKIKKFGLIKNGKGENSNFINLKVLTALRRLFSVKNIENGLAEKIQTVVELNLRSFAFKFEPVLVHSDPARENAIYTPDRKWVLIDWDNATSSTWVEDYADLTFWTDYHTTLSEAKKRKALIRSNFFRGYGKINFKPQEIDKIEHALHILMCVQKLPYYYYTQKNMDGYRYVKNKLSRLLKENQ
jgi:thiamine kinase-like enzyme